MKYYCDYCDITIRDKSNDVRRHLKSLGHQKNIKEHYNKIRDPQTALQEELAKGPCKRFLSGIECAFGSICRFSHYSNDELNYLRYQASVFEEQPESKEHVVPTAPNTSVLIETWLLKREKHKEMLLYELMENWNIPKEAIEANTVAQNYGVTKIPSLRKFDVSDFLSDSFETWG